MAFTNKTWFLVLDTVGDSTPRMDVTNFWLRGGTSSGELAFSSQGVEIYRGFVDAGDFGPIAMTVQQFKDVTLEEVPTGAQLIVFGYTGYWGRG